MAPLNLKGYHVLDKIKDGTVGTVWRAVNSAGNPYAIKQLSAQHASDSALVRQFKREATLTRKLSHPNIIKVYDYVDADPQPFFVMEYFESHNLKYAMANHPSWLHKREFQILMAIADALSYVHERDILHKDVKPENVLVSPRGDVRLIDFSLATTKWDRFFQFKKKVEGTPMYMAPEQINGGKCDARTDMYSFGVLMYELLTKRPPFIAQEMSKFLDKHLREKPPPLRSHVPTIAPELDTFVLRLLSKAPDARFPDMRTVMQELSRWIKQETVVRLRQVRAAAFEYPQQASSTVPV
jgi:serine/threonine-protein kinase